MTEAKAATWNHSALLAGLQALETGGRNLATWVNTLPAEMQPIAAEVSNRVLNRHKQLTHWDAELPGELAAEIIKTLPDSHATA